MSRASIDEILDPLTLAQSEELERRWNDFQDNPDEGEPWDDVKKSLLNE